MNGMVCPVIAQSHGRICPAIIQVQEEIKQEGWNAGYQYGWGNRLTVNPWPKDTWQWKLWRESYREGYKDS